MNAIKCPFQIGWEYRVRIFSPGLNWSIMYSMQRFFKLMAAIQYRYA